MAESPKSRRPGPLTDLKVLDLAGPIGAYCGKLLADLGADVVRIEPPGGDPMRDIGPFFDDDPEPEKSLFDRYEDIVRQPETANSSSIFLS